MDLGCFQSVSSRYLPHSPYLIYEVKPRVDYESADYESPQVLCTIGSSVTHSHQLTRDLEALRMKVSGIDPAPRRGLTVFDGADHDIKLEESAAFVADLASDDDLLVCWDAPLTGPPSSVVGGAAAKGADLTQRPIESFFSRAGTGFKTPPGISVQGYAGCAHWTITRNLLGLPRVGRFDAPDESLPFHLLTDHDQRSVAGRCVVEVHPALALWLWCRESRDAAASWNYKKDRTVLIELWLQLLTAPAVAQVLGAAGG